MHEVWQVVVRKLQCAWVRFRHPDLAVLADQMTNSGVFHDSTVIPPNAGSGPVIEWFEERLAYADTSATQFCFVRLVPAGVNIKQRGWTKLGVDLCLWDGYPAAWKSEGAPTVAASIPATHKRLFLSMLYSVPIDDDGVTQPATDAAYSFGCSNI